MPSLGEAATSGTVVLKVGRTQKAYHVHKALLTHHSEYFRKTLEGPRREATEGAVTMEDVKPAVVEIFIHWLYSQNLPKASYAYEWFCITAYAHPLSTYLLKGYIFADRFMVPNFRRAMNNTLVDYLDDVTGYDLVPIIKEAYANIPADRPFLEFLVDRYCQYQLSCVRHDLAMIHQLPHTFLIRTLRCMSEIHSGNVKARIHLYARCYREHATKKEKKECPKAHMKYCSKTGYGYFSKWTNCARCKEENDDQDSNGEEQNVSHSDSD